MWRKLWNSAVIMSWVSLIVRQLPLVVIVPMALTKFSAEATVVWLLISALFSLQLVFDAGFSQTFARTIALCMGGATLQEFGSLRYRKKEKSKTSPNLLSLRRVLGTLPIIYLALATVAAIILGLIGRAMLVGPVDAMENASVGWNAWYFALAGSVLFLWGNQFSAILIGMDRIAVLRRWEAVTGLLSASTAIGVLVHYGDLLSLVIVSQLWVIIGVIRNRFLALESLREYHVTLNYAPDREAFFVVWPAAWRSGVGIAMSFGLIQSSGIAVAQVSTAERGAAYMLALRVLQAISQLSQVFFYTRLPTLARLRAAHKNHEALHIAFRGMLLSHWTFATGVVLLTLAASPLLILIGSNISLPDLPVWSVLVLAFFVERAGAMYIQLYSVTNHIIWHIANGLTGMLFILTALTGYQFFGEIAVPGAMLISYLLIYLPISLRASAQAYGFAVVSGDTTKIVKPLVMVLGGILAAALCG